MTAASDGRGGIVWRATCTGCGDVSHYDSNAFAEDRCRSCGSVAAGLVRAEASRPEALPPRTVVLRWYGTPAFTVGP